LTAVLTAFLAGDFAVVAMCYLLVLCVNLLGSFVKLVDPVI
jgi:hypothetical protein